MAEETQNVGKQVGKLAAKVLKLANVGAKKLEEYANKSADENNNENAKKLAQVMNKVSQVIEERGDRYVAKVEENAEDLVVKSKKTFEKAKEVYEEMKTRAEVAKEKANKDTGFEAELEDGFKGLTTEPSPAPAEVANEAPAEASEETAEVEVNEMTAGESDNGVDAEAVAVEEESDESDSESDSESDGESGDDD